MDSHPSLMVLMSVLFYTSILVFYTYVDVAAVSRCVWAVGTDQRR